MSYVAGDREYGFCNFNARTRHDINDSTLWDTNIPRGYLFSRSDRLVEWQSILIHAYEAIQDGTPVFVTQFHNSAHCAHIRDSRDAWLYWETVQAVWQSRSLSATSPTSIVDRNVLSFRISSPTCIQRHSTWPSANSVSTEASMTGSLAQATMSDDKEALTGEILEWRPCKQEYSVMITLALISVMVALDSTILGPVLPVSLGRSNLHDASAINNFYRHSLRIFTVQRLTHSGLGRHIS